MECILSLNFIHNAMREMWSTCLPLVVHVQDEGAGDSQLINSVYLDNRSHMMPSVSLISCPMQ